MSGNRIASFVLALAGIVPVMACDEKPPETASSEQAARDDVAASETPATTAPDAGLPDDPLLRTLQRRAAEHAPKMIPAQDPFQATVQAGRTHEFLAVLTGGLCYKVVGVEGEGVEYLEMTLLDPNQVPAQHVSGDDRVPLLGVQEPICPHQTGRYQVRVKAHGDAGRYAVGVFRSKF